MSKKSFTQAPRPKTITPETIDAYVQGGAGHDTTSPLTLTGTNSPVDIPMKRLSIDLSEDTHRRFKAACAATGKKMASEITTFVEQRTIELEQEARKST